MPHPCLPVSICSIIQDPTSALRPFLTDAKRSPGPLRMYDPFSQAGRRPETSAGTSSAAARSVPEYAALRAAALGHEDGAALAASLPLTAGSASTSRATLPQGMRATRRGADAREALRGGGTEVAPRPSGPPLL